MPPEFSPESILDPERPFDVREANVVQVALIERSGVEAAEWIARHATHFRDLIAENAEVRRKLRHNLNDALDEVEAWLMAMESGRQAA